MRKAKQILNELRDTDVSTLNTLDKILPLLKTQLKLINKSDLDLVNRGDIYSIKIPVYFLQHSFFNVWLRNAASTVNHLGNKDGAGYIDLTNEVSGYTTKPIDVRLTVWLPWTIANSENGLDLNLFYGLVEDDLVVIETVMSTVTDPFFKNYYSQRFASALQDILLVVYTINEMVAFYEWRR
jgi:hypothetical protein